MDGQRERPADGRSASDYADNGGDTYTSPAAPKAPLWASYPVNSEAGPASLADGGVDGSLQQVAEARGTFANIAAAATGVIYTGSLVKLADITDGTSNTYLLGEKNLNPEAYDSGTNAADNEAALMGDNGDVSRWTGADNGDTVVWLPPLPDTPGYWTWYEFGSAHSVGLNMSLCDGSVRVINYSIDPEAHRRLGNRKDGLPIDGKKFLRPLPLKHKRGFHFPSRSSR